MNNIEFYRGPSLLTGEPIIAAATGFAYASGNAKTGPMIQTWILRQDRGPMQAARENIDDAICGDCRLRGDRGLGRKCYVPLWLAPLNVWKAWTAGKYETVTSWPDLRARFAGCDVRISAYGDPAALPFEVWRVLLETAAGWTGYTHQWRICDPRFKAITMASVDTQDEFLAAHLAGWRTFRVRLRNEPLLARKKSALEFICPASDEGEHRTTCERCQLCRGTSSPARSVVIYAHGNPGTVAHFYRRGPDLRPEEIRQPAVAVPVFRGPR